MAQSLSPFLAYYAAPALEEFHDDICDVARANAASIAKFRVRQQQVEQRRQSFQNDASAASSKPDSAEGPGASQGMTVASPFSAVSNPEAASQSADQPPKAAPPPRSGESKASRPSSHHTHNPFAQAATISFSETTAEPPPPADSEPKPEQHKQPVSPFAAAAEASGRAFETCLQSTRPDRPPGKWDGQSAGHRPVGRHGSASSGSAHSDTGGSVKSVHSANSNEACEELAVDAAHQEHQEQGMFSLDTPFVFKRKPVSSAQVRRYSTSTFFQGVLHAPKGHLSHLSSLSTMGTVPEETARDREEQQQQQEEEEDDSRQQLQQALHPRPQTVFVDDFSYASVAQGTGRRALSTPSQPAGVGDTLDLSGIHGQLQAHGSCPGPLLGEMPARDGPAPDATGLLAAAKTHLALQGQINKTSDQLDVVARQAAEAFAPRVATPNSKRPSRLSGQLDAPTSRVDEPFVDAGVSHVENPDFEEISSPVKRADGPSSRRSAPSQHPLWMTFVDTRMEEEFGIWMGQRCSNVRALSAAPACMQKACRMLTLPFVVHSHANAWLIRRQHCHATHFVTSCIMTVSGICYILGIHCNINLLWGKHYILIQSLVHALCVHGDCTDTDNRLVQVDTIFMLAATVYITQLLFFTWALADQQAKKWPLLGYTMLPILLLQHGDTAW